MTERSPFRCFKTSRSIGHFALMLTIRFPLSLSVRNDADATKDVSGQGEIVRDAFGGSGPTSIAANKIGRRARLVELDPI